MKPLNYSELKFPVVWIPRKVVRVCADENQLCSFNNTLVNAGYCKEVMIIDSNLILYDTKTTKTGWIHPFWGFRFNLQRVAKLDYSIKSEPRKISVKELAEMVDKVYRRRSSSAAILPGEREEELRSMVTLELIINSSGGVKKRKWWENFWFNHSRY